MLMIYPPAPWRLKGNGLQTLHLVDIDRIRPFVPAHLKIFSCFPGKTLGGIYVGIYEEGSTLQYSELIAVPALIQEQGRIGVWISHIYVDNPDSVAGGREIWGLPKELAQFTWEGAGVIVRQDDRPLCRLRSAWQLPAIEHPVQVPAFSLINRLSHFAGKGKVRWQGAGVELYIPPASPLAALGLGQPLLGVRLSALDLSVESPTIVEP
jgi:acetoacetate decarboxylase